VTDVIKQPIRDAPANRSRGAALLRSLAIALLVAGTLAASAWVARRPLLREVAYLWIVSDAVAPADAVAVFGGGVQVRPFAAARYYREGLVKTVLLSDDHVGPAVALGAVQSDIDFNHAVLTKLGVPESAIETFGNGSSNTYEEAVALRDWAKRTGAHSIIVPTEIFSARRVRWTLHRVFGEGYVIRVPALDDPNYGPADWWRSARGVVAFQNEVLKYWYYRLRYCREPPLIICRSLPPR